MSNPERKAKKAEEKKRLAGKLIWNSFLYATAVRDSDGELDWKENPFVDAASYVAPGEWKRNWEAEKKARRLGAPELSPEKLEDFKNQLVEAMVEAIKKDTKPEVTMTAVPAQKPWTPPELPAPVDAAALTHLAKLYEARDVDGFCAALEAANDATRLEGFGLVSEANKDGAFLKAAHFKVGIMMVDTANRLNAAKKYHEKQAKMSKPNIPAEILTLMQSATFGAPYGLSGQKWMMQVTTKEGANVIGTWMHETHPSFQECTTKLQEYADANGLNFSLKEC